MMPRRRHSQAAVRFVAPRTDPTGADWKARTNNTSRSDTYREKNPAPRPATIWHDKITPVSKSGTLITQGGKKKSR